MKTLLIATLTLLTATLANASTKSEIGRKADILGKMAFGTTEHKRIKGDDAEDMIKALMVKQGADDGDFIRNLPASKINFSDMVGWGTMGLKAAIDLYSSDDGNSSRSARQMEVAERVLNELHDMGAKFGFTDGSSSYCGVSFMGLLIVDEESHTIYEIALTDSGTC